MPEERDEIDVLETIQKFLDDIDIGREALSNYMNIIRVIGDQFRSLNRVYTFQIPTTGYYMDVPEINLRTLFNTVFGVRERIGKVFGSFFGSFDALLNQIYQYETTFQEYKTEPVVNVLERLREISNIRNLIERKIKVPLQLGLEIPEFQIGEINLRDILPRQVFRDITNQFSAYTRLFRNNIVSLHRLFQSTIGIDIPQQDIIDINTILRGGTVNINGIRRQFVPFIENINRMITEFGLQPQFEEAFGIERITDITQLTSGIAKWLGEQISQIENIGERTALRTITVSDINFGRQLYDVIRNLVTQGIDNIKINVPEETIEKINTGDIEGALNDILQFIGNNVNEGIYKQIFQLTRLRDQLSRIDISRIPENERGDIIQTIRFYRNEIDRALARIFSTGEIIEPAQIQGLLQGAGEELGEFGINIPQIYQQLNEFTRFGRELRDQIQKDFTERLQTTFKLTQYIDRVTNLIQQGIPAHEAIIEAIPFEELAVNLARTTWEKNRRFFEALGGRFSNEQEFINAFVEKYMEQINRYRENISEKIQEHGLRELLQAFTPIYGPIGGVYEALRGIEGKEKISPRVINRLLAEGAHQVLTNISEAVETIFLPFRNVITELSGIVSSTSSEISVNKVFPIGSILTRKLSQYESFIDRLSNTIQSGQIFEVGLRLMPEENLNELRELLNQKLIDINNQRRQISQELLNLVKGFRGAPELRRQIEKGISFRDLINIINQHRQIRENINDRLLTQIYAGAQEEEALAGAYIESIGLEYNLPFINVRNLNRFVAERGNILLANLNTAISHLYQRINQIIPMMGIGYDFIGGLEVGPEFYTKNLQIIKNIMGGGLSFEHFNIIQQRLSRFLTMIQLPEITEDVHASVQMFRDTFSSYFKTLEQLTNALSYGLGENIPAGQIGRGDVIRLYTLIRDNPVFRELRQSLESMYGIEFVEGAPPVRIIEKFSRTIAQLTGVGSIEEITPTTLRENLSRLRNYFNEFIEPSLQEIETGKATLRTRVERFFQSMNEGLGFVSRQLAHSLAFVMTMPAISPMWLLGMQPAQYAIQTIHPIMSGIGGLTGIPVLYQSMMQFAYTLPQHLSALQEQFVAISTLMRSRIAGEQAIATALELARWQPIQFEEAMQTLMAFTIYPETRIAIQRPDFQRQVLETVQLLGMLVPEQGIQGAIFAIRELLGNQFRSIERRFNISRELLASYAGVTMEEFKDLPGPEKLRTLHKALTELFVGGEEVLLQRGFMFDVQVRNIIDTLIRSIIQPLTTLTRPDVANRLFNLTILRGGSLPIEYIVPEIWSRYRTVAQRYYQYMTPEERQRYGTREEAILTIARELFIEQNATITGQLSTFFAFINESLNRFFTGMNVPDLISNFITKLFTPAYTETGLIPTWTQRITSLERMNAGASEWRRAFLEFVSDLANTVREGMLEFKSTINTGEIRQVIREVSDVVMDISLTAIEPIASLATKAGITLMTRFPKMLGEIMSDAVRTSIDNTQIERPFAPLTNNLQGLSNIAGMIALISSATQITTPFPQRLGLGIAGAMLPNVVEDIRNINTTGIEKLIFDAFMTISGAILAIGKGPQIGNQIFKNIPDIFEFGNIRFDRLSNVLSKIPISEATEESRSIVNVVRSFTGGLEQIRNYLRTAGRLLTAITFIPAGLSAIHLTRGMFGIGIETQKEQETELLKGLPLIGGIGAFTLQRTGMFRQIPIIREMGPLETFLTGFYLTQDITEFVNNYIKNIEMTDNEIAQNLHQYLINRRKMYEGLSRTIGGIGGAVLGSMIGRPVIGFFLGEELGGRILSEPLEWISEALGIEKEYDNRVREFRRMFFEQIEIKRRRQAEAFLTRFKDTFGFELPTRVPVINVEEFMRQTNITNMQNIEIPPLEPINITQTVNLQNLLQEAMVKPYQRIRNILINSINRVNEVIRQSIERNKINENVDALTGILGAPIVETPTQQYPKRNIDVVNKLIESGKFNELQETIMNASKLLYETRRHIGQMFKNIGINLDENQITQIVSRIITGEQPEDIMNYIDTTVNVGQEYKERIRNYIETQVKGITEYRKRFEQILKDVGVPENVLTQLSRETFNIRTLQDITSPMREFVTQMNNWLFGTTNAIYGILRQLALKDITIPEIPRFGMEDIENPQQYFERLQQFRAKLVENFRFMMGNLFNFRALEGYLMLGGLAGAENPFETFMNSLQTYFTKFGTTLASQPEIALQYVRNPEMITMAMMALRGEQFDRFISMLFETVNTVMKVGSGVMTPTQIAQQYAISNATINIANANVNITTN